MGRQDSKEVPPPDQAPRLGDQRPEVGKNIRSTYVGSYVIFFRCNDGIVEIVRVMRGDRDIAIALIVATRGRSATSRVQ